MGVTKHFVQEKPENKQVKGQQNQIMWGLQPISRQSKFIVGKNEKNMADKRDRKWRGKRDRPSLILVRTLNCFPKVSSPVSGRIFMTMITLWSWVADRENFSSRFWWIEKSGRAWKCMMRHHLTFEKFQISKSFQFKVIFGVVSLWYITQFVISKKAGIFFFVRKITNSIGLKWKMKSLFLAQQSFPQDACWVNCGVFLFISFSSYRKFVLEIIRINKYTYIACDILFVVFLICNKTHPMVCTALNKMDLHFNLIRNESEYQEVKKNFFKFLRASNVLYGWMAEQWIVSIATSFFLIY
jgi:hypothetical protein